MRLTLTSTGGFAGPAAPKVISIELDRLEGAHRSQIASAIDALSAHPPLSAVPRTSADFLHTLTIDDGDQRRSFTFHDGQATPPLSTLLALVRHSENR